jgi:hypothetical protein
VERDSNLLYLTEFEVVRTSREILWPLRTPPVDRLMDRYVVKLWPLCRFPLTNFIVARPKPVLAAGAEPAVGVIVPARNEAGNIPHIFSRVPDMGGGTELIGAPARGSLSTACAWSTRWESAPCAFSICWGTSSSAWRSRGR